MKPTFILKESALKVSPINESSDDYHNLFIAKRDMVFSSGGRKVPVPKGTVLSAIGGGYFGDNSGKIQLGNIKALDGNFKQGYGGIKNDTENFIEVSDPTWDMATTLTDKIEDWCRDRGMIEDAAKRGDIQSIKNAIVNRINTIKKIESLLK